MKLRLSQFYIFWTHILCPNFENKSDFNYISEHKRVLRCLLGIRAVQKVLCDPAQLSRRGFSRSVYMKLFLSRLKNDTFPRKHKYLCINIDVFVNSSSKMTLYWWKIQLFFIKVRLDCGRRPPAVFQTQKWHFSRKTSIFMRKYWCFREF